MQFGCACNLGAHALWVRMARSSAEPAAMPPAERSRAKGLERPDEFFVRRAVPPPAKAEGGLRCWHAWCGSIHSPPFIPAPQDSLAGTAVAAAPPLSACCSRQTS
eukprot:365741-Chlamydomonas_euryale.AAC.7